VLRGDQPGAIPGSATAHNDAVPRFGVTVKARDEMKVIADLTTDNRNVF
jgi:hypothetical protein